jgi:hypothetical protein
MVLTFGPLAFLMSDGLIPRNPTILHFLTSDASRDPWPYTWVFDMDIEGELLGAYKPMDGDLPPAFCHATRSALALDLDYPPLGFGLSVAAGKVLLRLHRPLPLASLPPVLKTACCFVAVSTLALENRGIVVHSSGTVADGQAHLFCGPHGQGKSTTANLLGADRKFSDDISFILDDGAGGLVCGGLTRPETRVLPLGSLNFLQRAERSNLGPHLSPALAYKSLLQRTVMWPEFLPGEAAIEAFIARVAGTVPCRSLSANLSDLARPVLFPREA